MVVYIVYGCVYSLLVFLVLFILSFLDYGIILARILSSRLPALAWGGG